MRLKLALVVTLTAILVLSGLRPAAAQTSKGILAGVVHDSSGAVVPGAKITATNADTQEVRTTTTQGDGAYRIDALPPGRYNVVAVQSGFSNANTENLVVNPSVVTTHDVTFSIGGSSTEVTVEAQNSGINTENGQLAGVISTRQIQDLPIFTLNPVELALTVPGVQPVSQNSGFSNGFNIQVNGARSRSNNFLIDGQEVNDVGIGGQAFVAQIPDIFQNITVITNNASAEYGRAGGAIVNQITRAGTNTFHGEVYERYTGSGLNAIDGVSRQSPGFNKTRYNQHQYGFTAGGPIIKDKLFAFGGLFISRFYGSATPNRLELPDANGYATLQAIGGPQVALLDQYLSNGSYLTNFNSFPGRIVTNINVGNGQTVTTGFFQRPSASQSAPETQWLYRVDYSPRSRDNFSFRYLHDRSNLTPDFGNNGSALPGFDTQVGGPSELGAGTWTHVFGPRIVNELRASETRISFAFAPTPGSLANPLYALSTLNIPNVAVDSNGASSLGPNQNFPQGRSEDLYQIQDTVSITKGVQTLRVGFDIGRTIEKDLVSLNAKGTLSFNRGGSGISGLGNFLQNQLGPSGTATRTFGSTRVDPHGYRSGVFAQDDVKLNPDLTLNLGIRYDYLTNPENSLPFPAIDPNNPFLPINTVRKVSNDTNNIAPRIGFAYSPHGEGFLANGKTVLRGGFGIFYDSAFSNFVINAAQAAPNAIAGTLIQTTGNGLPNATSLIPTISATLNPRSSVQSVVDNTVNPVTYQYNLGIERQLPGSNLVSIRYVGTLGKKQYSNRQYNYFAPDGSGLRLNPTRGAINVRGNFSSFDYNAAQVEFTHNFAHGFLISANYVFSKDLDNASEIFTTGAAPTSYQANLGANGLQQENGPSAYDHRDFFSVSYVWAPAGFHSSNAFTNAALGIFTRHWNISGIEQFQTGSYSSFNTLNVDQNGDGSSANDRPLIGNLRAPLATAGIDGHFVGGTTGTYYDVATAVNGDGSLNPVLPGSVHWLIPYQPLNQNLLQEIGRNSFSNPGSTRNDIAVEKGIGTKYLHLDRGSFIVRVEAQNIGNHNDVGILDTNVTDIGSGSFLNRPNARLSGGRNLVLWAKFAF